MDIGLKFGLLLSPLLCTVVTMALFQIFGIVLVTIERIISWVMVRARTSIESLRDLVVIPSLEIELVIFILDTSLSTDAILVV